MEQNVCTMDYQMSLDEIVIEKKFKLSIQSFKWGPTIGG